ncbi:MAG: hypothetical protein RJQ00_08610 [Vicingaceae bacterium]
MKKLVTKVLFAFAIISMMSSCSYRLVDFTVISTKNAEIGADRSKGVPTEGKKAYIFGFGWNIKDATDAALENAGKEYDLLIDGVVNYVSYPFVAVVKVKGVAISSAQLQSDLGIEGYNDWLKAHNISNGENVEVVEVIKE